MNLSIRHYRALAAIADLNSFIEASRLLHVSNSALSQMVRIIEGQIGFPVFERTPHMVRLTEAGRAFLPHVWKVLAEHDAACLAVRGIKDQREAIVRVAATQLINSTFLPAAILACAHDATEVSLRLVDVDAEKLQDALLNGDADIAIGPERVCGPLIHSEPLFAADLQLACHPAHPLASRRSVTWKQVAQERLIFVDRRSPALLQRDIGHRYPIAAWLEVTYITTALALIAEQQGVIISGAYGLPLVQAFGLRMVPIRQPTVTRQVMMYRRVDISAAPAIERVYRLLHRHVHPPGTQPRASP